MGAGIFFLPRTVSGDSKNAPARLETFTAEQKAHWAYQPLKRPELPDVRKLS